MTHYDTLEIKKDASEVEIRKAFKKLALKHHPDRGGDTEKFQEIQKAYDTLIDPVKRDEYNDSLNGGGGRGIGSLFDMFFQQRQRHHVQKSPDVNFELSIDLEHSFTGATKKIKITRRIICSQCDGQGTPLEENKTKCPSCDGTGQISHLRHMGMMQIVQNQPCHHCQQKGYIIKPEHNCKSCNGSCTTNNTQELEIPLRKGCRDGEIIIFEGMADELPNTIPGDLLIHIRIKRHRVFTRKDNDLYIIKELTLYEALKGYEFIIKQLDGTNLRIQHSGTTQPETISSIDGKGMPLIDSPNRGKLLIHFKVKLPENIPENIIDMLIRYK